MPSLSYLAVLLLAFLGVDHSDTHDDLGDPCPTSQVSDYGDGYTGDWYAWERCLLGDRRGDVPEWRLARTDIHTLAAEIWAEYEPWVRQALTRSGSGWETNEQRPWWRQVTRVDLEPLRVHIGAQAIADHCPGNRGCAAPYTASGCTIPCQAPFPSEDTGHAVWHWADGGSVSYDLRASYIAVEENGVTIADRNLFLLLHEIAHAIASRQWYGPSLYDDTGPSAAVQRGTSGHGHGFRCLLLDLYHRHGRGAVPDDVYRPLNDVCMALVPDYPRPITAPLPPNR